MAEEVKAPDVWSYVPIDGTSVEVRWRPVEGADFYEVMGGGSTLPRVVSTAAGTTAVIKGLVRIANTTVQVRANVRGRYSEWSRIAVRPSIGLPESPDNASRIPLADEDRQSMVLRLPDTNGANVDVRLSIWWQPSDASWWGSLEMPINTQAVSSRRLGLNCGVLDGIDYLLAGNIVMRATGELDNIVPTRTSISEGVHALFWEPA